MIRCIDADDEQFVAGRQRCVRERTAEFRYIPRHHTTGHEIETTRIKDESMVRDWTSGCRPNRAATKTCRTGANVLSILPYFSTRAAEQKPARLGLAARTVPFVRRGLGTECRAKTVQACPRRQGAAGSVTEIAVKPRRSVPPRVRTRVFGRRRPLTVVQGNPRPAVRNELAAPADRLAECGRGDDTPFRQWLRARNTGSTRRYGPHSAAAP